MGVLGSIKINEEIGKEGSRWLEKPEWMNEIGQPLLSLLAVEDFTYELTKIGHGEI